MFATITPVIVPIVACIVLGIWWGRSQPSFPNGFVGDLVMKIGAPALIIGTLGATDLAFSALLEVALAALVLMLITAILAVLVCTICGWPVRDIGVPLVAGNSGNMGLPLCLFAFGPEGLALSLGVFVLFSLIHFSLGTAILTASVPGRALLRSPLIWSGLLAIVLIAFEVEFSTTVGNTLNLLGGMAIPLMLLTLGVSLVELKLRDAATALAMGAARIGVSLTAGVITVMVLELEGVLRGVILLQAATPAAVFNYLLAQQYRRSPEAVAGLVMASTVISFATIPLVVGFLL
ncbi:AEC family transporter [Litorivivens sp.]